nr:MAG TPA: hypothetical protein [Caudoviricetes sp.]
MSSVAKYLGVTLDYVLYDISYQNLLLYLHAAPSYESKGKTGKGKADEVKDAKELTLQDMQSFY